ncbi:hypothetical protein [[Curtobacterium] plantarum]|uniref:Uncharacterized protein n=1 Tax=[Curtobacterium] plantarum TaxID=221276 RepID=A0ABT9T6F9_9GAMM|nr:hypothetical protein [[Curtobacterium] plantarum]MDQ0019057.1 hypothetical protein [[Curtobacterium] plantarum]
MMLRVSVRTEQNPDLALDAKITPGTRMGLSTVVQNDELKVFRCKEADIIFNGLGYDHQVSFSVNRADFVTYYYQARDDEGFIFQSNP